MTTLEGSLEASRAKRLKAATNEVHEALDQRIMLSDPFAGRDRYALFVTVQYQFHREIDGLYADPALDRLLPDLSRRRRFNLIVQDLADLGKAPPDSDVPPTFGGGVKTDVPTALGWLYVAEGSNLGAAFLLKEAAKLGLSENFGARHLAAAPEGRGRHWKSFTAALDVMSFSEAEEGRAIVGARSAFTRVRSLVDTFLPVASNSKHPE